MKIGLMTLLLLFCTQVHAQNSCRELFREKNYRALDNRKLDLISVYLNNIDRFKVNDKVELDLATVYPKFKNQPLRPILNSGSINDGIYQFQDPVMGPSILKLYRFDERNLAQLHEIDGLYVLASEGVLSVIANVRGNLLAQDFGGPKLYESGFVSSRQGRFYFYIQMESMFIDTSFYSLKSVLRDHSKRAVLNRLLRTHPEVRGRVVKMFDEVSKYGIVPYDPDIAISKDGNVRWIDTDIWNLGDEAQIKANRDYLLTLLDDVKRAKFRF